MKRPVDPAAFGAVLAALWAAHDLADHVLQTEYQAHHKACEGRHGYRALAGHVASYSAVQVVALAALRGGFAPARVAAGVAFSAGTHALLDRRWPVRWILEHTGHDDYALSHVQAERELLVCANVDADPDGPTNLEEAGHALGVAVHAVGRGTFREVGDALAYAIRHAVAVVDPEHPTPLHGPYLADQALHHACLAVVAAIIAGRQR